MSAFQSLRNLLDLDSRLPDASDQELIAAATTMVAIDGIGRILSKHPTRSLPHTMAHLVFDLLLIEHLLLRPVSSIDTALRQAFRGKMPSTPKTLLAWRDRLAPLALGHRQDRELFARTLAIEVGALVEMAHTVANEPHRMGRLDSLLAQVFAEVCSLAAETQTSMRESLFTSQHAAWEARLANTLRLP